MTMADIDMEGYTDEWSWDREDFLSVFSHPRWGDPRSAIDTLYNDSMWKVET